MSTESMNLATAPARTASAPVWVSPRTLLSTVMARVFAPVDMSPAAGIDGPLLSVWCNRLNR
ncbi:hypothetical protein [Nocardia huaxiensis]|uniref:Uncharacterized protein n=1 Tax=Nocardia huaxiensis TaxID=2755382 RepID=A0A7D6VCN8_9NOCA|nr:hypothetical protein [Nocardia huaxiensis]QLY31222.1 hypothetical protein H0264_02225 [Nocardia huaxiensis]UFS94757.1 hypothetical protein LPY97_29055 [Nocardia huaxiensis]